LTSEADASANEAERVATLRSHSACVTNAMVSVAEHSGSERIHFINEKNVFISERNVFISERNAFISERNLFLRQDDRSVYEKVDAASVRDARTTTKKTLASESGCSAIVKKHVIRVGNRVLGEGAGIDYQEK
jgi:hypothetical protein